MMPTVKGMSHMIPNHVLRVGQTICLDPPKETVTHCTSLPKSHHDDPDLDISLENLNQLILELDPTFELIQDNKSPTCISPPTDASCSDEDVSEVVLIPRGCSTVSSRRRVPSVSPSIPIPTHSGLGCGSHGMLVFSSSPTSSLPPLPLGSAHRRNLSPKNDHASLRLSRSNRNSTASLLSTSTCSDTSYILGSNLSLAGEDLDPDSTMSGCCSDDSRVKSCDNKHSWEKALMPKRGHLQDVSSRRAQNCPASVSGSLTDIPLLLVNGAPQPDLHRPEPDIDLLQSVPLPKPAHPASQARFNGSQPSMKFVMDTSKFWFRPHVSRAEAEALIRDKEAGTFVVRDSTSYRGSFGLAMKVDQTPPSVPAGACPGESSDLIRHFLIESSAKGVRIKGSSQEPYFGSLSALVYQHTISAYALPCRLRLCCHDLGSAEERSRQRAASEDKHKAAASNFIYLVAVPTETLTGPCAVQKAVSFTLEKAPGSFTPTIVNMKVSLKGVTLTDINRKLFFRRHYPAHLLSYGGEDPDNRVWMRGSSSGARLFGFVAKGVEAGTENVCHVFAEYDSLQDCNEVIEVIQAAVAKP